MAGPHPQDNYSPNNIVSPQTGAPNDYLGNKASGAEFGAQVGAANQGLGKVLENAGNEGMNLAIQTQGLANEHAANAAEMELAVQGGEIYDKYKSLTGFDASNSKDKAIQDYLAVNQKIRDSLGNPAAQRAYDALATRRMSYTIQDMNSYAAAQVKKAYQVGKTASMNLDIDSTSRPEIANNPTQFGYLLGSIKFKAADLFTNPTYGTYRTIPATQNKDGSLQFDTSTDQGKVAQADYDNYVNTATGKAYKNATLTQAYGLDGNPRKANAFLEENKNKMPAATYAELSHQLTPAIKNEEIRSRVDQMFTSISDQYQIDPTSTLGNNPVETIQGLFPGLKVTSTFRTPEKNASVGGVSDSMHLTGQAADVVLPQGVSFDQFKESLLAKGLHPTELLNEGDHIHVGWAQKNQGSQPGSGNYTSYADYLGTHEAELEQQARAQYPNDSVLADRAAAEVQTRVNQVRSSQLAGDRANEDVVLQNLNSGAIKSQHDLDNAADPKLKMAWASLQARNPIYANNITTRILPAMARGMQVEYGTDFYKHLQSTLQGAETPTSLSSQIGSDKYSPLTNNGYKVLTDIAGKGTNPSDVAFNRAESEYLKRLHSQFTGAGQFPGISETDTNHQWNQALMEIIPKINAGRAQGMTADQLFNPESKDYIQTGVQPPSRTQLMNLVVSNAMNAVKSQKQYSSLDDLKKDVGKGITRDAAIKYAFSKHWIQENPPQVPLPE